MPSCREVATSEEYADFIVTYAGSEPQQIFEQFETECYQRISSFFGTVYRKLDDIEELSLKNYAYNSIPALYGLMENDISLRRNDKEAALEQAGIYRLQNQPALQLRGQGCIVGFVDTGINIEDMDFRFSNGDTRILRIWDMTDNEGVPPLGISYGSEYDETSINELLRNELSQNGLSQNGLSQDGLLQNELLQNELPQDGISQNGLDGNNLSGLNISYPGHDNNNHGNILAKIAAGNDGAAPDCRIVAVKLKEAKRYLRDYHKIREDALAYQENDIMLAVNYIKDVGLQLKMPVVLCIALGTNSRSHDGRSALSYVLDSFSSIQSSACCVAGGEEGNKQLHARGNTDMGMELNTVELRVDERQEGLVVHIWGMNPQVLSVGLVSPTGEVIPRIPARLGRSDTYRLLFEETIVTIEYDLAESASGDELILIRFDKPTSGIWKIQIDGGRFDAYLPISQFLYEGTYFLVPEPDTTIIDPAYARRVITSVDYNPSSGALYIGQGRGFSRNGYIKPDLASPVSVSVLTGASALLLGWGVQYGDLDVIESADIKTYLIRGANRENTMTYPNKEWGYGKLDAYNAFEVLRGN